jgi:hypothetical protein
MPTGIFHTRNPDLATARATKFAKPKRVSKGRTSRAHGDAQRAQFAEHLAEGLSVGEAAAAMCLSKQSGSKMLAQIRAELGPQAC